MAMAAAQIAQRRRAHRAGRADFRLTAARRARDGRFGRDDLTDCARDIHRAHHRLVAQPLALLIRQQHRGQNAAAPRRRRGDDALHAGVAFAHLQRLRDNPADVIPADGFAPLHIGAHFFAVAADHAAGGAELRVIAALRAPDGGVKAAHLFKGFRLRHAAIHAVALDDDVADIPVFACRYKRLKRFNGHTDSPCYSSRSASMNVTRVMPSQRSSHARPSGGTALSVSIIITAFPPGWSR